MIVQSQTTGPVNEISFISNRRVCNKWCYLTNSCRLPQKLRGINISKTFLDRFLQLGYINRAWINESKF